jgi:peptidoglycan-N-acetylglucosamine deacetylase
MRLFRPVNPVGWLFPEAIFRIDSSEKTALITFDDGPHPESTPAILETLDHSGTKAIFFCSGLSAERYPELISEIKRRGHTVGNHGYLHLDGWFVSEETYCRDVMKAAAFTSGTLFRPPYGRMRISHYRNLIKNYKIFFWDIMPYDFDSTFGAGHSMAVLNKNLRPGSVIVLHDTPSSTCISFLKDFIEGSLAKDFSFKIPGEYSHQSAQEL